MLGAIELETSLSPEKILSPEELESIQLETQLRRNNSTPSFLYEMDHTNGVGKGDYQQDIDMLNLENPVDIVAESVDYIHALIDLGVQRVNIVDFGTGAARTISAIAERLHEQISQGKVQIIATDLFAVPTTEEIDKLASEEYKYRTDLHLEPAHAQLLKNVLTNKSVTFLRADILELFEYMKGEPIHLLFMMNTFSSTEDINDIILKMLAKMLDRQYGTAILGLENLDNDRRYYNTSFEASRPERNGRSYRELLYEGLNHLRENGFRRTDRGTDWSSQSINIYQAPQAPHFNLRQESRESTSITESKPVSPPSVWKKLGRFLKH